MSRFLRTLVVVAGMGTLGACGDDGPGENALPDGCDPTVKACTVEHDFGDVTLLAGEERDGYCQIWTLDNPSELWVSSVTAENDGGYHHSNWFFVPNTNYDVPDGPIDCDSIGFDELSAAIAGGVLFAQSTQSTSETQAFPPGAAVRVPPWSKVVASTHLLNTGDAMLSSGLRVRVETLPEPQVTVPLTPFRLTYHDLHLPPQSASQFESTCELAATYQEVTGEALSLDLYYVLPHFHGLATQFELHLVGGARDGEQLYQYDAASTEEAWGKSFAEPIHLGGADGPTGFRFMCGFTNPREVEVGWGIGDQEMCVMLGFARSGMAFEAYVADGTGAVTGSTEGTITNGGPCALLGLPFDQDKGGGRPPQ